jgi:hypothetical protein
MGSTSWKKGDAFKVVCEGRLSLPCEIAWDSTIDGSSANVGIPGMLDSWLAAPGVEGNSDILSMKLLKI